MNMSHVCAINIEKRKKSWEEQGVFILVASEVLLKSCLTLLLPGCREIEDHGPKCLVVPRNAAHGTQEAKRDRQEGARARCLSETCPPVTDFLQAGTVFTIPPSPMAY